MTDAAAPTDQWPAMLAIRVENSVGGLRLSEFRILYVRMLRVPGLMSTLRLSTHCLRNLKSFHRQAARSSSCVLRLPPESWCPSREVATLRSGWLEACRKKLALAKPHVLSRRSPECPNVSFHGQTETGASRRRRPSCSGLPRNRVVATARGPICNARSVRPAQELNSRAEQRTQ